MSDRDGKQGWKPFLFKATLLSTVIVGSISYVTARYSFVFDPTERTSLESSLFIIDRFDTNPDRGDYIAFLFGEDDDFYKQGTLFGKKLVGLPKDRVVSHVDYDGDNQSGRILINGEVVAKGFFHKDKLSMSWEELSIDETIPANSYYVVGELPYSYDSRYWRYISSDQFVGTMTPIN